MNTTMNTAPPLRHGVFASLRSTTLDGSSVPHPYVPLWRDKRGGAPAIRRMPSWSSAIPACAELELGDPRGTVLSESGSLCRLVTLPE
jgi:hypothetical protein